MPNEKRITGTIIAPMQYTLGIFTRFGTSPKAVASMRIATPNGPVIKMHNKIINAITKRFIIFPSIPFNIPAERDSAIVII
jgi:hypothetical protein